MTSRAGGCLCGAVRYAAEGKPLWVAHCHCRSCRRQSGAPVVTWAGYRPANVAWSSGPPDTFNSAEDVTRRFCGACGTPLSYEGTRWPDELHILVATLDDPESLTPTAHVFWSEHLSWLEIDDGLKKFETIGSSPVSNS
ncbi:MAG: GFA family protein [Alphaproteobacteria bacterium]|nr:GFA family protein [Alphaproteobacteria bacterium]